MGYKIIGKEVGDIGFGLLGLSWRGVGKVSDGDAIAVMKAALDAGSNYWNGGEFYGSPGANSLTLVQKYFEKYPEDVDKVVLNIKGGVITRPTWMMDCSKEGVSRSIENCLGELGPHARIDVFECARRDPKVPYEESILAIAEYVKAGKVGGVACSEISASTIRKAAAVTNITSVEVEISLWQTDPLHNGIASTCAELGIPILAYSPLGRGFLTGKIRSQADITDPFHKMLPRFSPENFETNFKLVQEVEKLAAKKGCTPAQIAINWVLAQSEKPGMPKIIPIPGASSVERVKENTTIVPLTDEDLAEIEKTLASFTPAGDRYHAAGMEMLDSEE